jgi:general secretion pathway protein A
MTETFYGDFYGFRSAPFHITPDPALLFPTETHRAALGAIEYGISAGKGFIVVTGEVGVGKTTVLRSCLDALDPRKIKVIYLFNPALSTSELYAEILDEFDVTLPPTSSTSETLRTLQRTLLAVNRDGIQVVLAVDEAQRMPEDTLEGLRILSNLETHRSKLLQIILVGQPELESILAKHSLRQLAQRVAVRARVAPLTFRQSCRYITHRARLAGREPGRPLFTRAALLYLARVGRGIPRTINVCCDNALINGYGHGAARIGLGIARESCKAIRFRSPLRRTLTAATFVMALIGAGVSAEVVIRHFLSAQAAANASANAPQEVLSHPALGTVVERPQAAPEAPRSEIPPPAGGANPSPTTEGSATAPDTHPGPDGVQRTDAAQDGSASAPLSPGGKSGGAAPAPAAPAADPAAAPGVGASTAEQAAEAAVGGAAADAKWVVRPGDTLYHACVATYGECDGRTLQALLARNPRIAADHVVYVGEVISLPRLPN